MSVDNENVWTVAGWRQIRKIINESEFDYRDDFILWLSENPHIWRAFAGKVIEARKFEHRSRFSSRAIIEVLRWETMLQDADATFKINNNYAADLSRLVMDCKPELVGYFRVNNSSIRKDGCMV